jgi:SAM-dependent methyltransferase
VFRIARHIPYLKTSSLTYCGCQMMRAFLSSGVVEVPFLKGLRRAGWQGQYCGVDISAAAIRVASDIETGPNSSWIVSDIESFDSHLKWDVIALIESVYYIKIKKVVEVLNCAMRILNPGGYVLLRIHDSSKHHQYIDAIHRLDARVQHTGPLFLLLPRQSAPLTTAANH